MDLDNKYSLMAIDMKAIFKMDINMAKELSNGQMDLSIRACLKWVICGEKDPIEKEILIMKDCFKKMQKFRKMGL